jgi:cytochrome c oxidase assembly protein subunit 19
MSAGGSFGGARGYQPKPPEKGVFPLDHFGECQAVKEKYMACLKEHNGQTEACREVAKLYLECRMDKNLMAQQSLRDLGFEESTKRSPSSSSSSAEVQPQQREDSRTKEKQGFVAGTAQFKYKDQRHKDSK